MGKGHPHAHLQRALERGNVVAALAAARQAGTLQLGDALGIVLLLAAREPARYRRAAVRWHGRFELEARPSLEESQLVLAALAGLRDAEGGACSVLRDAARRHSLLGVDAAVKRFLAALHAPAGDRRR